VGSILLLKLKRVEIHGFKSFYDRTEMKFSGTGIAAVVGPNGCGKSNLSDAISWVLGEQSAKSLRGARMEDVIFAGTRDRKALGMASVTMTLVPDERIFRAHHIGVEPASPDQGSGLARPEAASAEWPVSTTNGHGHSADAHASASKAPKSDAAKAAERTGEITITRRLYRSGESEYLIGGKPARLRDIQDLFLGTGLGPESYAIIEQGRIGQILSNRPQDRRAVIEEAAGITKFKTRKRLAESRLESAKQNLARVFDILEEVTRQANSLKRQASKTRRYAELKTEEVLYLRQVLAAKYKLLERQTAQTAIELNLSSSELKALHESVAQKEQEQSSALEASFAVERQLTEARQKLADLQLEAERTRGRLEYQIRQIQQTGERLAKSEVESRQLEVQEQEGTAERDKQNVELAVLDQQRQTASELLEAKAAERQRAQASLSEQERALEASRQQVLRLLNEASGLKNRITQAEAQLASSDRESKRARDVAEQAEADLARIATLRGELAGHLTARQSELASVSDQRKRVELDLQSQRTAVQETRHVVDRQRSEYSRIKARRDSLSEVLSHRSYTTETVKRLFSALEQRQAEGLRPLGVLADFVEVEPQHEKATEEFLHEELEFVVVRDWQDAERGIDLLRSDLDGRATFLVEALQHPAAERVQKPGPSGEGIVAGLGEALRFTNGLSNAPLDLLPRVANCFLVVDRPAAQRLALEYPDCFFLAPDGVSYHGNAVSGGKKTGAGPLALKRELREVSELERKKQEELQAIQARLSELESAVASLGEQLDALRSEQQSREKEVLALDHDSRKLAEEFSRSNNQLESARAEIERTSRDRVAVEARAERDRDQHRAIEAARSEQESWLTASRESIESSHAAVALLSEEHSTLRANLASFDERHRAMIANRSRIESRLTEIAQQLANLARESERMLAERAQLEASNQGLSAHSEQLAAAIVDLEVQVAGLAEAEAAHRASVSGAEEVLKSLRANAQGLQEARSELQIALARLESDLKHLEETASHELGTTLAELSAAVDSPAGDAFLAEVDAKYQEVRRKIEALGPVNPQALEEYEEAQQRHDFLSTQRQDLIDSIRDTEKAIEEIDTESRKRFAEAFHAINANFKQLFSGLFGGGAGEMRLTDEQNVTESGIDIVASPPGKKLQNILLLSGGEKSLTAMALLMSIFQYTPSPFCVLDEVDAALDEPNIQRLTKLLCQMSDQTQFIVITHAKRTMEAAQSLYGVTMQEPGISKLVSVKFRAAAVDPSRPGARASGERRELVYETIGA
jgi:chromosome segregation protein